MTAVRRVRCVVDSMTYSACDMQPGDWFEVGPDGVRMPDGQPFCFFAMLSVLPLVNGRLGGEDLESWLESRPMLQCPDPPEGLWMRLEAAADDAGEGAV